MRLKREILKKWPYLVYLQHFCGAWKATAPSDWERCEVLALTAPHGSTFHDFARTGETNAVLINPFECLPSEVLRCGRRYFN
jgi:hypothetical protein